MKAARSADRERTREGEDDRVTTSWTCGSCGSGRPDLTEPPPPTNRPPCPTCGATSLQFSVSVHESVGAVGELVSHDLLPGVQPAGWRQRWEQLQRDVDAACGTQEGPLSAEAVRDATTRLYDLFVRTYHLREHLNSDAGITVSHADIVASPALALSADICNTEKHVVLDRGAKSGASPRFVECRGGANNGEDGWRLKVTIDHGGVTKDGVAVLRAAIGEWHRLLSASGLI